MKLYLNILNRYPLKKSRKRYRADSYWTGEYPSPEPSEFMKSAGRIGNWIYNSVDSFFSGASQQPFYENAHSNSSSINPCVGYCQVWELNQDITDIALKDIEVSLHYLFPAYCRQFLNNLYQNVCLYFQADYTIQEESFVLHDEDFIFTEKPTGDCPKKVILLQHKIDKKDVKLLLFRDWVKAAIRISNRFLRIRKIKKTFYLPGNFTPAKYEYSHDNQNYMIRGPDKPKLSPAISFHNRN